MKRPTVIAAALMLGMTSLAFAQTSPQTSPSTAPRAAPAPGAGAGGSGTTAPARQLTEADIKSGLEGLGYSQVTDIKKSADGFTAKAMRGGQQVALHIDPTGKVSQR